MNVYIERYAIVHQIYDSKNDYSNVNIEIASKYGIR